MKHPRKRASQQGQTLAPTRFTNPPPIPFPPTHQQCIVLGVQVSLSPASLSLSLSTYPFRFPPLLPHPQQVL